MEDKYKDKILTIPSVLSGILIGICTVLALLSAFLYGKDNIRILLDRRKSYAQT